MTTLPVAEARARFSQMVDAAATTHERFDITRNGTRVAVVLGADDYDSLVDTIAILSDEELVGEVGQGLADLAEGRSSTSEAMREAMRAVGRAS